MQTTNEKQRLPLARASAAGGLSLPDAKAIEKLFSVATTQEAAIYFYEQLDKQAKVLGLTVEFNAVLHEVNQFVDLVKTQSDPSSGYWSGELKDAAVTKFMKFQQHLSEAATDTLTKNMSGQTLAFDFAINADSQLLQGFSSEGNPLDDNAAAQVNYIFSDWLTQNHMICREGVIYEALADGSLKEGQNGKPQPADPEQYATLFKDRGRGFASFVDRKTESKLTVEVTQREYPSQQATSQT